MIGRVAQGMLLHFVLEAKKPRVYNKARDIFGLTDFSKELKLVKMRIKKRENKMATHLNLTGVVDRKDRKGAKLHWMPCIIKSNGKAEVSKYFEPIIAKRKDGVLRASFRGFPLLGKEIELPENYSGVVLQQTGERLSLETDRNLYGTAMFEKFTYWNWDVEPSGNDKIIQAMDWLAVAEALHSPVGS